MMPNDDNNNRFPEFWSEAVIALELVLEVCLLPLGREVQTTHHTGYVQRGGGGVRFGGVLQSIHNKL